MMKKQTAVEWIYDEWSRNGTIFIEDLDKAKQMEREQIEEAYKEGWQALTAEQYYNETYLK
jgi:DNA invertase Pin-like site-specific DNA recombinase